MNAQSNSIIIILSLPLSSSIDSVALKLLASAILLLMVMNTETDDTLPSVALYTRESNETSTPMYIIF